MPLLVALELFHTVFWMVSDGCSQVVFVQMV